MFCQDLNNNRYNNLLIQFCYYFGYWKRELRSWYTTRDWLKFLKMADFCDEEDKPVIQTNEQSMKTAISSVLPFAAISYVLVILYEFMKTKNGATF